MEDFQFTSDSIISLNLGDKSTIVRNITIIILTDGLIEADEYFAFYLQAISPLSSIVENVTAAIQILSEDGELKFVDHLYMAF